MPVTEQFLREDEPMAPATQQQGQSGSLCCKGGLCRKPRDGPIFLQISETIRKCPVWGDGKGQKGSPRFPVWPGTTVEKMLLREKLWEIPKRLLLASVFQLKSP